MKEYISYKIFANPKRNKVLNQVTIQNENPPNKLKIKNCSPTNISSLLVFYINSCYYLGLIPYKIVPNHRTGLCKVETNTAQKIFCYICVWMPICIFEITSIPSKYWNGFLNTPTLSAKSYFIVLSNCLHTLECIQFFWVCCNCRTQILNTVNDLPLISSICSHDTDGEYKAVLLLRRCQIFLKTYYVISYATILTIFLFVYRVGMEPVSPIVLFQKLIVDGKQRTLFLAGNWKHLNISEMSPSIITNNFLSSDIVFGMMETWLRLCVHLTYTSIEFLYTGPLPLTMWLATELFVVGKEKMPNITWSEFTTDLITKFELLKSTSNSLNSIWSLGLFIWMFEASLRLIFLMNKLIASKDPLNLTNAAISVFITAIVMFLSGEVYRKMDNFREWLMQKEIWCCFSETNHLELKWLLEESKNKSVGLGISGFYKLTYGFIAQLTSLAVTLFLVSFEK